MEQQDKFGKPLSFYKQEIDLFEFMKLHGYTQMGDDKDKTSRNHRRLTNPVSGEKFIIKQNNNNEFTYYSPHDTSIKGSTIIDFVQHHYSQERPNEKFHLGKVRKILDSYLAGELTNGVIPKLVDAKHSSKNLLSSHVSNSLSDDVLKEIYCVTDLFNTNFLTEHRNIDIDTIKSPAFKGRVFNSVYEHENQKIINTAFLFINRENKVCGLSVRNKTAEKSYKRIFEGKQGLVCSNDLSNSPDLKNCPTVFFLCESFIDAMSHYELNKQSLQDKNFRYFSTEGTPSEAQVLLFDQLVQHYKPQSLHFATDNDKAGNMFSTLLLCSFNNNTISHFTKDTSLVEDADVFTFPDNANFKPELFVDFDKVNKVEHFGQLSISFHTDSVVDTTELCAKFNEYFQQFNSNHVFENGEKNAFEITFKEIDKQAKIILTFKNNLECWGSTYNLIHDLRFNKSMNLVRDMPLLNDFNEDLQLFKNKHPKYMLKEENEQKIVVYRSNPERNVNPKMQF